jgi:hypothetical protein
MCQLRVLLVHNNPVACEGDGDSVRVMDDLAARVRGGGGGGGRARCDWKFVGSTGEDGQRPDIGSVVEPSFGYESMLDDVPKELNTAAAAISAAARRGGAAEAQYDVLPRKVGDFAAASSTAAVRPRRDAWLQVREMRGAMAAHEHAAAVSVQLLRQLKAEGGEELCRLHVVSGCV